MSGIAVQSGKRAISRSAFLALRQLQLYALRHSSSFPHPHQLHAGSSTIYNSPPHLPHPYPNHCWTSSFNKPTAAARPSHFSLGSCQRNLRFINTATQDSAPPDQQQVLHQSERPKNADLESSDYWGIVPKEWRREDGSLWPWRSFSPSETYSADLSIDVERHYPSDRTLVDKLAYGTVRALRKPVDFFFKDRHVSHALLLETVAAVPGMVGGMLLHLRSLRRFEQSGGWIRALLEEAENERMHLMTWVEVMRPAWWERALVLAVQGTFFNAYFLLYMASPRLAHRFVAYLEEEAVRSYSEFLESIDAAQTPNRPAPLIAIDYWRLPKDATIRDVVLVVRADEAHHRDVNHFAADVYTEKRELRGSPAPVGYH